MTEFIIGIIVCLVILIAIFLVLFFCRRNRNNKNVEPKITTNLEDEPPAPTKIKQRLDILQKRADEVLNNNQIKLEENKKDFNEPILQLK